MYLFKRFIGITVALSMAVMNFTTFDSAAETSTTQLPVAPQMELSLPSEIEENTVDLPVGDVLPVKQIQLSPEALKSIDANLEASKKEESKTSSSPMLMKSQLLNSSTVGYPDTTYYSTYAYDKLTADQQSLYNAMVTQADAIQLSSDNITGVVDDGTTIYPFTSTVEGKTYSKDDISIVFLSFVYDNPQYFWLYCWGWGYHYSDETETKIDGVLAFCRDEFADGETRSAKWSTIKTNIASYITDVTANGGTTDYSKAQYLYEKLCENVEYALDEYGNPEQDPFAHSIEGAFDGDSDTQIVCEGYAKVYELLLNIMGIDSISVTGLGDPNNPDSGHMWNMVEMDNNWYWVDATWDDTDQFANEYGLYFLRGSLNWSMHQPDDTQMDSNNDGYTDWQYALPAVSESDYTAAPIYIVQYPTQVNMSNLCNVDLSVYTTPIDGGTNTYTWKKNDTLVGTTTEPYYELAGAAGNLDGTYTVEIKHTLNGETTTTSNGCAVTLSDHINTIVPDFEATKSANVGDSVTFSINVDNGDDIYSYTNKYQWYKDGAKIEGANDSTYTIENATTDKSGIYFAIVSNNIFKTTGDYILNVDCTKLCTLTVSDPAETTTETSETTTETSETTTETSETTAETSETTTETSETTTETSETTAETSETTAETSETTAETSETTAETSETTAETSETTAETSETTTVDTITSDTTDSPVPVYTPDPHEKQSLITKLDSVLSGLKDGDNLTIKSTSTDKTIVSSVLSTIKGKDIDVIIEVADGISVSFNGKDIPDSWSAKDINFNMSFDTSNIPEENIEEFAGNQRKKLLSLDFDGAFGFNVNVKFHIGYLESGKTASLYYYNPETEAFELMASSKINGGGDAKFIFTHASDYVILISDENGLIKNRTKMSYDSEDTSSEDTTNPKTGGSKLPATLVVLSGATIASIVFSKKKLIK